jgi:phosphatidylserine/phosphatidylglycerophosphate/cardiolipin synthase-like enzyme
MRVFLGGDLRSRLFELLDEARGHIYAALFELSDEAILTKLKKLKSRAHIVLSNGTHKSRTDDENTEARADLVENRCEVFNRMLPAKTLGHNKFMVITDEGKKPLCAWTGSTNWTPTGLCTQINNGLLVNDPQVAQIFFD